jgi:two-component system, NarL family, sensor histidine kinase UhpB
MNEPLKILHLEDVPADAELIERALKKSSLKFEKLLVANRQDFIRALKEFNPDIIISDHSLPSFDSQEALKIVHEMGITVPFILVTATVSEEYAVNVMKEGAWDYILKDRLQRLPNAIISALDKYKLESERKQNEDVVRASEKKYKLLFESNPMPMWMLDRESLKILDVNEAAINHYGYPKEEFMQLDATQLRPEEDVLQYLAYSRRATSGLNKAGVWRHKKKNGDIILVEIIAHDVIFEDRPARLILANDITERRKAETELARQRIMQQKLITETSVAAQEREREEIGKELHDNINQILSATKLYLEFAKIAEEELLPDLLDKSCKHLLHAIDEIRRLSHRLVAPSLEDISLVQAFSQLVTNMLNVSSLKLTLDTENYHDEVTDTNIRLMFYRIVQEQLNNILKHSGARNATIRLQTSEGHIILTVTDDGAGFDTNTTAAGIGLRNITNRAAVYNGTTRIVSEPGKGCMLEVSIPLKVREKNNTVELSS